MKASPNTSPKQKVPSSMKHMTLLISTLVILCTILSSPAADVSDLTWESNLGEVTILDCDRAAVGILTIPATLGGDPVTKISEQAFYGCDSLTHINFPASITELSQDSFDDALNLQSISMDAANPNFSSNDGVLFNKNFTILIKYPAGKTDADYSIPNTVTTIERMAFSNCNNLVNVTLSNSITEVPNTSFIWCDNLEVVNIPSSVSSIDGSAFLALEKLRSFIVDPANPHLSSVNGVLFNKAQTELIRYPQNKVGSTYSVPATTTKIAESAFQSQAFLSSVTLPTSLSSIGEWAFYVCEKLTSINLPTGITTIESSTFRRCISLTSISIPQTVRSIGSSAFQECESLLSIELPDNLTHLGSYSFAHSGIKNISIPNSITNINERVFYAARDLETIDLPDNLTSIGYTAFFACNSLEHIHLPRTLLSIGGGAFFGANTLTKVVIPAATTTIGDRAFYSCTSLESTYFLGDAPASFGSDVFKDVTENHLIYYLDTSTGFTSPLWNGYPTQVINTTTYPAARWLLESNYSYDTDLNQDLNGDGVTLLMAYALNLPSNERLGGRLPKAQLNSDSDSLSLSYYGGSMGITYRVETSKDLNSWTTTGVSISAPDTDGVYTASIPLDDVSGFLRLMVVEEQNGTAP